MNREEDIKRQPSEKMVHKPINQMPDYTWEQQEV